jgi:hypothetical protein
MLDLVIGISRSIGSSLAANSFGLGIGALVATSIGLCVALAEHHRVLGPRVLATVAIAALLFLFYPRVILASTLLRLLGEYVSVPYAQSVWGFALSSIPAGIGLAYLIFSLTLQLEQYSRTSTGYIQNARFVRLPTLLAVAAVPFQAWFSAVLLITFSVMVFQGAMLGSTVPMTVGRYLDRTLGGTDPGIWIRLIAVGAALALLALFVLFIPWLWRKLSALLARASLRIPSLPLDQGRNRSPKRITGAIARVVTLVTLAASLVLHLGVLLRLFGLLPAFEEGFATFNPTFLMEAFGSGFDQGVGGALFGALAICIIWFVLLSRSIETGRKFNPLYLGVVAFIPSSFIGAVVVLLPAFPYSTEILLFLWGLATSGALVALLVSGHVVGRKLYRYDNLRRTRNTSTSLAYFGLEYWRTILGLLFLAALFNGVDAGFREQFAVDGLASNFTAKLGDWSQSERGLALVLCLFLTALVLLLRADTGARDAVRANT